MVCPAVINTIPCGVNPAGMAITPDGQRLYIANNNSYGIPGQDSVTVVDLTTQKVLTNIFASSFQQPYTITIVGNRACVTNSNGSSLTVLDTITNTVVEVIEGFDGPSGMVVSLNQKTGFVNNYGGPGGKGSGNGHTVGVLDLITNQVVGEIEVGLAPADLAITPDGTRIYVINYETGEPNTGTISIIDVGSRSVIGTIPGFFGPFNIRISPNGRFAYVSNFGSNNFSPFGTTLSVIDLSSHAVVKTHVLGIQPSGIAISPDENHVYTTNYNTLYQDPIHFQDLTPGQGLVSVIATKTQTVRCQTIPVSPSPANAIVSPDGRHLFVSSYNGNVVNIIRLTRRSE